MAYSKEFRLGVVAYLEAGNSHVQAQQKFNVGLTAINRWSQKYQKTGDVGGSTLCPKKPLKNRIIRHGRSMFNREKIKAYIINNPNAYAHEVAAKIGCSMSTVRKVYKQYGLPYKPVLKLEPTELEAYLEKHPQATVCEIAEKFSCSSVTVRNTLNQHDFGLAHIKRIRLDYREIMQYMDNHPELPLIEIAKRLGCSTTTLCKIRKICGAERKQMPSRPTIDIEEFRTYLKTHPQRYTKRYLQRV